MSKLVEVLLKKTPIKWKKWRLSSNTDEIQEILMYDEKDTIEWSFLSKQYCWTFSVLPEIKIWHLFWRLENTNRWPYKQKIGFIIGFKTKYTEERQQSLEL